MPTKIAIVEDSADICEELTHMLAGDPDFKCVAVCRNAATALKRIPAATPDVIIMDVHLPDGSGIDCTARLKRVLPEAQILMFTIHEETQQIVKALEAGASGYLLKYTARSEILAAIRDIRDYGAPMNREVARKLINSFHRPTQAPSAEPLTLRESEILELLGEGLLYKEIGDRLTITRYTVACHVKNIYRKLHVRSRMEAVMKYRR